MKIIKRALLSVIALLPFYADASNGLWLVKSDGNRIGYVFDQEINISYTSKNIVISTNSATVEYPFDEVKRVCFDDNVTGIAEMTFAERQQFIRIVSNGLELKGFNTAISVSISDMAGRTVLKRVTDADGVLYINWKNIPHGVYIVKADKTTIKFYNK